MCGGLFIHIMWAFNSERSRSPTPGRREKGGAEMGIEEIPKSNFKFYTPANYSTLLKLCNTVQFQKKKNGDAIFEPYENILDEKMYKRIEGGLVDVSDMHKPMAHRGFSLEPRPLRVADVRESL